MNGNRRKIYTGIDLFKLICSVLIIYMHTYCFDGGVVGNWIKNILASVGVPFFFIVSGFFFAKGVASSNDSKAYVRKYLIRVVKMYIAWTIITLPVSWHNVSIAHSNYTILLKIIYIIRCFCFTGSLGVYWYIHSLIFGCFIWYIIWTQKVEKIFYPISIILFAIGVMYRGGLLTDTILGTIIHVVFGSERNVLNVGLLYIGIGVWFYKKNISIKFQSAIVMLILALVMKTVLYRVMVFEFMEVFAATALFFVALQMEILPLKKYSLKLREVSTAMYLIHFPFILLFDYYLRKGTYIDFFVTILFSLTVYFISKKWLPKKWSLIIFGS